MVRRPPARSRADVLIRLRRAVQAVSALSSLELRGASNGGICAAGVGFSATIGGDHVRDVLTCDEEAAAHLSAILAAAGLAPLPEEDHEVALGIG